MMVAGDVFAVVIVLGLCVLFSLLGWEGDGKK